MNTINPNWLAVAGALYALCGSGFLARASISSSLGHTANDSGEASAARRQLNIWAAVPLLLVGFVMHAMSQFGSVSLNPLMIGIMLLLAFALLLFGSLEDNFVDTLLNYRAQEISDDPVAEELVSTEALEHVTNGHLRSMETAH